MARLLGTILGDTCSSATFLASMLGCLEGGGTRGAELHSTQGLSYSMFRLLRLSDGSLVSAAVGAHEVEIKGGAALSQGCQNERASPCANSLQCSSNYGTNL